MANIVRATVSIRGIRPLCWHAFGPQSIPLPGEEQEKTGVAGNDPEEWKRTVLMTSERQLYIPASYIFSMCRTAAKHTKSGRGTIMDKVGATLVVDDNRILATRDGKPLLVPFDPCPDPEHSVYIDICGVRNPATKARNVRYRVAASPGWELTFHLLFDKTIVNREQMKAVLNDAGTLVGLADGRGIGYGRFTVENFDCEDA